MTLRRTLLVATTALAPTIAYAQGAPNPDDPPPPVTVEVTTTQPAPPTPPPPPPTVVVVSPQEPAIRPLASPAEPVDDEVYTSYNAPMVLTGGVLFLGSYGASAIVAGTSDHVGANRLYVPLVGPWLALNDWGNCPVGNAACDSTTTQKVLLVGDGIVQGLGVLAVLGGLFTSHHHQGRSRMADRGFHISPTHNGVVMSGQF